MLVRQQEQIDDHGDDDSSASEAGTDINNVSHDKAQIAYNAGYSTGSVKKNLDLLKADEVISEHDVVVGPQEPQLERKESKKSKVSMDAKIIDKSESEVLVEEKKVKEAADLADEKEEEKEELLKKELEKKGFLGRLAPYNKPAINIVFGLIVSCIQGCIFPVFGIFLTKMLFSLMISWDLEQMRSDSRRWCLYMFICAVVCFITTFTQKFCFGVVGENITLHVRHQLYQSLLKKHIGWFDARQNAPGVLTSVLASDAQTLNGASTEGLAVMCESFFALVCGIILGFVFSWKVSLVALGCVPFMVAGGSINAKFQSGMSESDEDAYKDANLLAGDAILNYRTVASFGHDYLIVQLYDEYISAPFQSAVKKAHCIGFWFGFSQFV